MAIRAAAFLKRMKSEEWLSVIRRDPQTMECVACLDQGGAVPLNLTATRRRRLP
ncbi:hypothetical protein IE4872_PD01205 (plasmid) [Rhizobium gallicum]|uniref:Uncharacterized protein n=1 Tax=Rhizobium gallicum TaxID=56730 RepID=A0A1L5NV17_9HYPH|nr:hypothetical protein IE4872_PD01205 [Rhizobium gallicum]